MTEFRDRWRSRKFRNNGHACTSIVLQINTDDEKDGFELFTGTMLYFRVLLYVREFTEQHHFRTSGPGRSLPVDSGCCSADLTLIKGELRWEGHSASDRRFWTSEAPTQTAQRTLLLILSKQKIFRYFMHMRAKTICGF